MAHNTIALICDCDETLAPDTSNTLVESLGLDAKAFWSQCGGLVAAGWDPPLAYLTHLLALSEKGTIPPLTRQVLQDIGGGIMFFPGVPDVVTNLRKAISQNQDYRDAGVQLEWYVVSGGIEELLHATALEAATNDIFACSFHYNEGGRAVSVKRAVTFTEKTKFIYAINKGISGEELKRSPYKVNDAIVPDARRVPVDHMIYVGDGPSDIPCFSMIKSLGGHAIGVMRSDDRELRKPYELARGQRLTVGPYTADYRPASDLYRMLDRLIRGIADDIVVERQQHMRSGPQH